MPWLISLAASLVSVWVVYSRIAHIMIMVIFMEHFTDQVSAGANSIGALMGMGLKIAVFKLAQVGLVVSSANRANL